MRKLITALVAHIYDPSRWLHRGESRGGAKTDVPSNEKLYPNRKGCLLPPIRPATLSPWLPPWLLRVWLRLPPILWLWLPPTLLRLRLPTLWLALLEHWQWQKPGSHEREAGLLCIG